ncbi:glutathione transferase [Xylaria intraflava]|nr:glutathione transferase [Xylaria intraflava]
MQPITLWLFPEGPNPLKVLYVLEELSIPYEIKAIKGREVKQAPLIRLNPNGRVPVIEDPNHNLVLWESGAILAYLVEKYDTDNSLTYTEGNEKYLVQQWLHFQTSGQGPYFGQASWFMRLHPEKVPSAIERYVNEINRVLGVLESHLKDREWLVGDKMTYADMAFVPYNYALHLLLKKPETEVFGDYPNVAAWHERLISRTSWARAIEVREALLQQQAV